MRVAGWFLVVTCVSQAAVALEAATVGNLGNPERLTIEGAQTFSPKQIKDALSSNSAFQLAADGVAPLDNYLRTIDGLIRAGYRHAGFPHVEVSVSADTNRSAVAVNVKEGVRYMAGEIRVRGNKTIPVAQLVGRLAKPHAPTDAVAQSWTECKGETTVRWADRNGKEVEECDPAWCIGKPAPFLTAPEPGSDLHREVADALSALGYFFARFSVDVVADAASKKAHFVVDISDEGTRTVLGSVDIIGNKANSREEILEYLGLQPASAATLDEQVRLQSKLWHSGRFIKSAVTLLRPATADEQAGLRIDLVELHGATPLGKPLSREEDLLLKCRDRMADVDRWDGDLILQINGDEGSWAIVFSPANGMFADHKYGGAPAREPTEYVTVFSPEEIGLYCVSGGRRLTMRPVSGQLIGSVGVRLDDDANNKEEERSRLMFSFGFKSGCSESKVPLNLSMAFDPAFFVDKAHRPGTKCTVQDGTLTMSATKETLRLDAASGRLLEFLVTDPDEDNPKDRRPTNQEISGKPPARQSQSAMRLSFVPGEFRRRVEAAHAAAAKVPNAYDVRRSLSSLLSFACDEDRLWQWLGVTEDRRVKHLVRQMLDQGVCEPLDKLVSKFLASSESNKSSNESGDFVIPEPIGSPQETNHDSAQWTACLLFVAQESFRPGSWPEVVSREAWKMAARRGASAVAQWHKLCESDESGPLCFLAASALLESMNPPMANLMASRGLKRLSVEDFRKEYPTVLDAQYPIGQCARRAAALLCELDDRDVQSLSALLPGRFATEFRQWVEGLRQDRKRSVDEAMPALLDALWQSGLREYVKAALEIVNYYSIAYTQQGNLDKTIADATQAIRLNAEVAEMYKVRAWAYAAKHEYDNAIADYTTAIRLDPKNGWAHYTRGSTYGMKRDFDSAIGDYTEAIRLDPEHLQTYYYARAWTYEQKDDYDNAIADYAEAIRLDPKDANAYYNRGSTYRRKGEQSRAMANYYAIAKPAGGGLAFEITRAHDEASGNATEGNPLGSSVLAAWRIIRKTDFDKAIADYTEAIRLNPKLAEAYYGRSLAYLAKGNSPQAETDMAEAKKLGIRLK